MEVGLNCINCGENMEGDGYHEVYYCPNYTGNDVEFTTPDDNPIYCEKDPNYVELD